MIDIECEALIPCSKVPEWCGHHLGQTVNRSTVHRWRVRGSRGARLETILAGGRRYTSHEALVRFFSAATASGNHAVANVLKKATPHAEEFLDREGI